MDINLIPNCDDIKLESINVDFSSDFSLVMCIFILNIYQSKFVTTERYKYTGFIGKISVDER